MHVTDAAQFSERDLKRFWAKVGLPDGNGCMNWRASRFKRKNGQLSYGCFGMPGTPVGAHRVSYVLANGSIPEGLTVDHICENTACVAPDHLRLLTDVANGTRAMCEDETGTRCAKGHSNWGYHKRQRVCKTCYNEYKRAWLQRHGN